MIKWADFKWNVVNKLFTMDVFSDLSYSDVNSLICQGWNSRVILITHNEKSNEVRISFPNEQIIVNGLEEAYQKLFEWKNS